MALPKINETLWHPVSIPSTGERFQFRPYVVKEEKVLLLAYESGDESVILDAISNTIQECCKTEIDPNKLTLFDFEYVFAQLRCFSVGQTTILGLKCSSAVDSAGICDHVNEVEIDISDVTIDVDLSKKTIALTDHFTVKMRWPSYKDGVQAALSGTGNKVQDMFDLLGRCIVSVESDDTIYSFEDESQEEIQKWLESLKADQLHKLFAFLDEMPSLKYPIEFVCSKCGSENEVMLEGLKDFF